VSKKELVLSERMKTAPVLFAAALSFSSASSQVFIKDCGLCRNIVQNETHELDFTASFNQTDGKTKKGRRRVYQAMNKTLNDQILLNESQITDSLSASNNYFVRIDYVHAFPDRDPGVVSTFPAPINNRIFYFENTTFEIQFAYDCCGDIELLSTEVFEAVVSSLVNEKEQLASAFQANLVVPNNWVFKNIYWNL